MRRESLDHGVATLRCPRCGDRDQVPALPLFVVTGPSGAGKTTVITRHQEFGAWLRTHISPSFDTAASTPDEVAGRVAAWVRESLDHHRRTDVRPTGR